MNPHVSQAHRKEKRWSAEDATLRQLCLASGLNEELKWGQACYDFDGGNVVVIHGFKDYCALLFMKGALLKDPKGIHSANQERTGRAATQVCLSRGYQQAEGGHKGLHRGGHCAREIRRPGEEEKRSAIRCARRVSTAFG